MKKLYFLLFKNDVLMSKRHHFLGDFKRFKENQYGYSFVYPKVWVGDTALELAKAERRTRSLDYTMKNGRKSTNTLPDAGKLMTKEYCNILNVKHYYPC